MGMLIDGLWTEEDRIIKDGAFVRQASVYHAALGSELLEAIAAQAGRFHLIASWSCPWSHRTMLLRTLKGLQQHIPLHITGGKRVEGYPANSGHSWRVPGSNRQIVHLHQLYRLSDPAYSGRVTVPVLWDSQEQRIVSNESGMIIRAFDAVRLDGRASTTASPPVALSATDFSLVPARLVAEIDELNLRIYQNLANATYRAGFAQSQSAYDAAVESVFSTLDWLEQRLAGQRFLLGEAITEADWLLFPTLVRFDVDYFIHSRCSRRRLLEYPHLWAYARDLFSWPGVADTVRFEAIHMSNVAENALVPAMPDADWSAPHERAALGPAKVFLRSGAAVRVEPGSGEHSGRRRCSGWRE
ncbi:glutathione S-transferase C-terminal domain-containing protein [Shewanella sp. AS16]|uniref:glutathione S-transferase family protein n=1 Tax=Shewanella sp. AS16 TaxID=2907625 RepID=UPI001F2572C1|nr:glutathione S-transferase C-terminal domain-containing protein [Shewanella sp. AS16]MCE9687575.1 glutathione S-transferase C-terminal domain-containing protein [Shewanella sp. AS16]